MNIDTRLSRLENGRQSPLPAGSEFDPSAYSADELAVIEAASEIVAEIPVAEMDEPQRELILRADTLLTRDTVEQFR